MGGLAPLARIAGVLALVVPLGGAVGCGGEVIHLGNGACPHAQVPASQVVWIGDSWVTIPGNQVTEVQDRARAAGAIGPTDSYTVDAANGTLMAQIAGQYAAQQATATPATVVIMDGGTLDTIMSDTSVTVSDVAATFDQLLASIAKDGTVTSVIYFLVPELPGVPGVAALRPLLDQDCSASTVPCSFVDLTPLWAGHPEYTASNGIFPTQAGASAIAGAIWGRMQSSCIAQ